MKLRKENGLKLSEIHPKKHEKYSPNLHRYLTHKRNQTHAVYDHVYLDRDDMLWIGYIDDVFFVGANLMRVMTHGSKETSGAYPLKHFPMREIQYFWDMYKDNGRCIMDRHHNISFLKSDNRYTQTSETRVCNWCGLHQKKKRWEEVVTREEWIDDED